MLTPASIVTVQRLRRRVLRFLLFFWARWRDAHAVFSGPATAVLLVLEAIERATEECASAIPRAKLDRGVARRHAPPCHAPIR